ncbi:MAG: hypothetical protein P4L53_04965 [Candidatus Obscuribacterales bacterium]|nr:hypothetical protein [Candidatus Obscuribacterales bacterium]
MPFEDLDWRRIDVMAIAGNWGLATIDEPQRKSCREWLRRQGYVIDSLNCTNGVSAAVTDLGKLLHWEEQFGYTLSPESRNLNALRDGFLEYLVEPPGSDRVFEMIRPDLLFQEEPEWLTGFLSIAQERCVGELALGHRFFTLLVVPDEKCTLIGQRIPDLRAVPYPCWDEHSFSI